ncbi:MAG: hypothetical protein PHF11_04900 [Candidatus Omnitrophica bacterium]|nr:hypothetical protein [Candidatus Omnitrophota bacterium]
MEKKKKSKFKGQAVVELAIFATIIIMVLAAFLSYAQRLESQQAIKMQAFREALLKAYKKNAAVSYTLKKDTRIFSPLSGFGQGQPSGAGATVSVMWQKGFAGPEHTTDQTNYAFYKINDQMLNSEDEGLPRMKKDVIGYDGTKHKDMLLPVNVYQEDRRQSDYYDTAVTKKEDSPAGTRGRIVSTSVYDLSSTITGKAYTRFDKAVSDPNNNPNPLPEYQDTGSYESTYHADIGDDNRIEYKTTNTPGKVIRGEKTWTTEFSK